MTHAYFSGPMRGWPDHNMAGFKSLEFYYKNFHPSHTFTNPRLNFGGDVDRPPSEYMNADLMQVLEADVIVQMEAGERYGNWQASEGATREAHLGVWAGKKFVRAELVQWTDTDQGPADEWRFTEIDAPEFSTSVRAQALEEAKELITGDRNNTYGPPWQDFSRTAGAANAYGYRGPNGRLLESHDVAILIMLVKISRLMWTPTKKDSWVDTAGYSGCGYECALHDAEVKRVSDEAAKRLRGQV